MKIKLTESQLRKIIEEELNSIILEETVQVDESLKSKLAGFGAGLAMMGGMGAAQAAPKAPVKAPAAVTAKADVEISEDVAKAAIGLLEGFESKDYDKFSIMKVQAHLMGAKDFITSLQKGKDYKGPELSKDEKYLRDSAIKVVKKYKQQDLEHFQDLVATGSKVKFG